MNVNIDPKQARELVLAAEAGRDKVYVDQDALTEAIEAVKSAAEQCEPGARA